MNRREMNQPGRLLQRYSTLEYLLLGDLRDLLEEPADEHTGKWLLAVLDALLETLPRQFNLKEEGGYMQVVLDEFPSWESQVDRLQCEHETLSAKLLQLRNQVVGQTSFGEAASRLRSELRDWMDSLKSHNRRENRLLQTAMTLEVGAGD